MAFVQCYVVDICGSVCLVLLRTLYGFVENIIVVIIREEVGNRTRCSGGWCIARKILYSHVYLCIHTYEIHGK